MKEVKFAVFIKHKRLHVARKSLFGKEGFALNIIAKHMLKTSVMHDTCSNNDIRRLHIFIRNVYTRYFPYARQFATLRKCEHVSAFIMRHFGMREKWTCLEFIEQKPRLPVLFSLSSRLVEVHSERKHSYAISKNRDFKALQRTIWNIFCLHVYIVICRG